MLVDSNDRALLYDPKMVEDAEESGDFALRVIIVGIVFYCCYAVVKRLTRPDKNTRKRDSD
jgi:hypothetical protein